MPDFTVCVQEAVEPKQAAKLPPYQAKTIFRRALNTVNHPILEDYLEKIASLPEFAGIAGIAGISVHTRGNWNSTPLHIAATQGDIAAIAALLDAGANIHSPGEHGYSPLHEAVEQGHIDAVRLLLERGASAHAINNDSETSIQTAAIHDHQEIIKLLQAGAGSTCAQQHPKIGSRNMLTLPPSIKQLFFAAGWQPHTASKSADPDNASSEGIATAILRQYAALHVGEVGSGAEQAKSDISFYSQLRPTVSVVTSPWRLQIGNCVAFATAHNDHMILFVNDQGRYFAFTDPDRRLYLLGDSFGNAMHTLLLGYNYGASLPRDS